MIEYVFFLCLKENIKLGLKKLEPKRILDKWKIFIY